MVINKNIKLIKITTLINAKGIKIFIKTQLIELDMLKLAKDLFIE